MQKIVFFQKMLAFIQLTPKGMQNKIINNKTSSLNTAL
jgi:hypothetical protein